MKRTCAVLGGLLLVVLTVSGCSATGAAMTGLNIGKNLSSKDSNLAIQLDGKAATQNMFKKATSGYSQWSVAGETSTAPTLRFDLSDPASFGRITSVMLQIHQKFEADYSHQAEFKVVAANTNDPQSQMKPGVDYNLGNLGSNFKVFNLTNQQVGGVTLQPGKEYMLVLTVVADRSESAQVYFKAGGAGQVTQASQATK